MTLKETQYVLLTIKSEYATFGKKDRIIADYIIDNPKKIVHSTISEIAEELNIAEATVFRFCKRIGFKGFQSLKIALASEVIESTKDIHERIEDSDNDRTITEKVFKSNILALEDTIKLLDFNIFNNAVEALLQARRIEFYGNGGSGIIAEDAHHKFLRTGLSSVAYKDFHLQLMAASQLSKDDVAVVISHSGANKNILEVLEISKEQGATTIGITSFSKSPLSRNVDIPLYVVSQETEYRFEAFASRIAQLSIIDALYINISLKRKNLTSIALKKMRNAISLTRL